jgi:hypothetical protein
VLEADLRLFDRRHAVRQRVHLQPTQTRSAADW